MGSIVAVSGPTAYCSIVTIVAAALVTITTTFSVAVPLLLLLSHNTTNSAFISFSFLNLLFFVVLSFLLFYCFRGIIFSTLIPALTDIISFALFIIIVLFHLFNFNININFIRPLAGQRDLLKLVMRLYVVVAATTTAATTTGVEGETAATACYGITFRGGCTCTPHTAWCTTVVAIHSKGTTITKIAAIVQCLLLYSLNELSFMTTAPVSHSGTCRRQG
jgi:hypothetical protein